MAVSSAVSLLYQNGNSSVVALAETVKATVQTWCSQRNYLFSSRIKTVESLAEKLDGGRYSSWLEVDDRFACTVVIPTVSHEERVLSFLRAVFTEVELRERNSTRKAPDVFRFDSTRWVGRLAEAVAATIAPGAGEILFEVQVQTVFEYAWSVVTHDLVYKSDTIDWKKARLAAQLKAAVEQIELTIATFEESAVSLPQSVHPETDEKVQLVLDLKQLMEDGRITSELAPTSWSRLAENVWALVRSYTPRASDQPHRMGRLREQLVAFLSSDDEYLELRSGSLFQLIIGLVGRGIVTDANLDKFVIVDSRELAAFHHLTSVPKPFEAPGLG
jgi:ppGpp synthetase/RelA/SpoT-type nucleotidyltranferase